MTDPRSTVYVDRLRSMGIALIQIDTDIRPRLHVTTPRGWTRGESLCMTGQVVRGEAPGLDSLMDKIQIIVDRVKAGMPRGIRADMRYGNTSGCGDSNQPGARNSVGNDFLPKRHSH